MANTNNHKKKRRQGAPQGAAGQKPEPKAQPEAPTEAPPDTEDKTLRWLGALCYLSILIIIPACSPRRSEEYLRFHLNQGLVLLALATIFGALSQISALSEIGITLTLLVDLISFIGLVLALRGRKAALPGVAQITKFFSPF